MIEDERLDAMQRHQAMKIVSELAYGKDAALRVLDLARELVIWGSQREANTPSRRAVGESLSAPA